MKDTEYNFYALTPIDDADIGVYESALDFVFAHENVRNVAVSGAYGAGKSSVLASYKKKHSDKKFLHISLAHFRSANETDDLAVVDGEVTAESILEGKILNQLIHQISPDKIPRTNFRVKRETSKKRNIITAILAAIGFVLGMYSFLFTRWATLVQSLTFDCLKNWLTFSEYTESRLVAGIGFFAITGIFAYRLIKLQESRHIIKKAEVSGIEIEIFEDSSESYFDKYLNEVLYLFENTDADVIVFEDIDRYDSSGIFERLHEINTLVNNDRKGTRLRFFYLMRDDIFLSKDRTKFFDFIIPIVPVVDASNSFDKFIECFEKNELIENEKTILDLEFLQGLSLYIDDMRIIHNICNEFLVYHGRISTTEQDPNKMLTLIAFKNLFPRDFADLQLGRGFMFEIIGGNGKERLISTEQAKLQKLIESKTAELSNVSNELLFTDEIAILYHSKICAAITRSNSQRFQPSDDPNTCKQQLERYRHQQQYKTIFAEYDNRLKNSDESISKRNTRLLNIESKISQATKQLNELNGLCLKNIITRENIDNLFKAKFKNETGEEDDFNQLKNSPYFALLKYLIREGFIDETYSDYMTYFYENSLTQTDKVFLRSVTDKKAKEATYLLDNPTMVVSRLPLLYFEQEETLNYTLFDFLLCDFVTECLFTDKAKRLIQQISENEHFNFILDYSEQKDQIVNMVKAFGVEWPSFVEDFFTALNIGKAPTTPKTKSNAFILKYAYTLLELVGKDAKRISFLDDASKKWLRVYLSHDADFLSVDECDDKNVAIGIKRLEVLFKAINATTAYHPLFERVYHDNSYVINFGNIKTMLGEFGSKPYINDLQTANYSVIMAETESPLAKYINANIDDYMNVILAECGEVITDATEKAISLLNNDSIEKTKKLSYISYLKNTIAELTDINDIALWRELLKNPSAIKYTATNIVAYVSANCKGSFDETLTSYINGKGTVVIFDDCFEDDSSRKAFFTIIVKSVSLSNHIYKGYLEQFILHYPTFSIKGLPQDKLTILDELGIIKISAELLSFMREHYNNYLIIFAAKHISDYIQIVSVLENYIREEALGLLNAKIQDSDKIALLKLDATPVTVNGKAYSDTITAYILQNNYDIADFRYLLKSYSVFGKQTRGTILEIATKSISNILSELNSINRELLSALFASDKVILKNKKTMFETLALSASDVEIKQWLPCVASNNFLALYENRKRPKYDNTKWNEILLRIFKTRGLIEDYELDGSSQKYAIIRRKKLFSKE
ncbi:MAG: hypothetical protein LBJ14_05485 [Desulfarculales bacterium]|jgi:hypothetical protein|nr:hypothetical protein [Desulfarculales bacterium]